jgi:putative iron-regulated protein
MRGIKGKFGVVSIIASFAMAWLSIGCNSNSQNGTDLEQKVISGYADHVYRSYTDALTSAKQLKSAIDVFLATPNENNLELAKGAWRTSRKFYSITEACRFYDGPIDNGEHGVEGLLNAWPLDEAYVDYVRGDLQTGIINDLITYPNITRELLVCLNEKGGEENISCGYHAIEFMLWGQDLDSVHAGNRPFTDFLPASPQNERRRTYLSLVTDLLIEHLTVVTEQWSPEIKENYRSAFVQADPAASLQKIFTGIGVMAKVELAGERMFTAYENASQEDEQSCFSDNTYEDLQNNLQGIAAIFYGSYDAPGIKVLLDAKAPEASKLVDTQLTVTRAAFKEMAQPFDQAIAKEEYRPNTMQAILAVQKLGNDIALAAKALQLTINVTNVQ